MHIRVCINRDGSVTFAGFDFGSEDYYTLDPEYAGACFAGIPGADRVESVEVAGEDFESSPVGSVGGFA